MLNNENSILATFSGNYWRRLTKGKKEKNKPQNGVGCDWTLLIYEANYKLARKQNINYN